MAKLAKFLQGVAGVGGAGLNVEEVFSTYLYEGNQTARTITNGIDLAGEGGLTWITPRTTNAEMQFIDSERGVSASSTPVLISSMSNGSINRSGAVTAYNSDGFDLGTYDATNYSGRDMVSWTFRKAPKFFDVVTYTGNNTRNRQISHNLGSAPGCIIVKRTDSTSYWPVYHRGLTSNDYYLRLNGTDAENEDGTMFDAAPTSTHFIIGDQSNINTSGASYVAYIFAHNNGDGDFGPNADQDIIKCGSYTGNGSTNGPVINLGFEPQWVLIKQTTVSGDGWHLFDTMRGLPTNSRYQALLQPHSTAAEIGDLGASVLEVLPNGFKLNNLSFDNVSGYNYIYIAIRRGPMAVPESATDVFDVQTAGNLSGLYSTSTGFTPDAAFYRDRDSNQNNILQARLTETQLITNSTSSEFTSYNSHLAGNQDGIRFDTTQNYGSSIIYQWKRAPNYFDVTCHTGNGQPTQQINHNLGVVPEMAWIKARNNANAWFVYHKDLTSGKNLILNSNAAETTSNANTAAAFYDTYWTPGDNGVLSGGGNTVTYIAYLFASLDGVSKVGSVTIQSGSTTVDCGFSGGPRFVLLKRTDGASSWNLFDSERGIVAGNDPYLNLNQTAAEITGNDLIDPTSSGFTLTSLWTAGQTWIYYAIA